MATSDTQTKTQAAAHHRAFQQGHHELRRLVHASDHAAKAAIEIPDRALARDGVVSAVAYVRQVAARAEMPAGPAQDHDADAAFGLDRRERRVEFGDRRAVHCVAPMRAVQGHEQRLAFLAQRQFVGLRQLDQRVLVAGGKAMDVVGGDATAKLDSGMPRRRDARLFACAVASPPRNACSITMPAGCLTAGQSFRAARSMDGNLAGSVRAGRRGVHGATACIQIVARLAPLLYLSVGLCIKRRCC